MRGSKFDINILIQTSQPMDSYGKECWLRLHCMKLFMYKIQTRTEVKTLVQARLLPELHGLTEKPGRTKGVTYLRDLVPGGELERRWDLGQLPLLG